MKRKIFAGIMAGLTITAVSACNWQYRRYHESIKKWGIIDQQFMPNYNIQNYQIADILNLEPEKNQYFLITTNGKLDKQLYKIYRYQEGRPGIMLCGILKNENDKIIVNLGWIPENYIHKIENLENLELNNMQAIIKLPEFQDKYTNQQQMQTFIDLNNIVEQNQLNEKAKHIFLERISMGEKDSGLFSQEGIPISNFQI